MRKFEFAHVAEGIARQAGALLRGFYEKGVTSQDPEEFLKSIDCYVMGSHTYELALELSKTYGWVYGDKPTIVITHHLPSFQAIHKTYTGKNNTAYATNLDYML